MKKKSNEEINNENFFNRNFGSPSVRSDNLGGVEDNPISRGHLRANKNYVSTV
jgi:hypothetical protein